MNLFVDSTNLLPFGNAARAMILTCRFEPGKIGGQAVSTLVQQRITFRVPGQAQPH